MTITWQSHHTLTTLLLPSLACCHTNSLQPREMPKQCHYGLFLSGYFHLICDYRTYSKDWDVWKLLISLTTWSRAQSQLCTVCCPGPGYGDTVKPTKLFIEHTGSREVEWLCYYLTKASLCHLNYITITKWHKVQHKLEVADYVMTLKYSLLQFHVVASQIAGYWQLFCSQSRL